MSCSWLFYGPLGMAAFLSPLAISPIERPPPTAGTVREMLSLAHSSNYTVAKLELSTILTARWLAKKTHRVCFCSGRSHLSFSKMCLPIIAQIIQRVKEGNCYSTPHQNRAGQIWRHLMGVGVSFDEVLPRETYIDRYIDGCCLRIGGK